MTNIMNDYSHSVCVDDDTAIVWRATARAGNEVRPLIAIMYKDMSFKEVHVISRFMRDFGFELYSTSIWTNTYHYYHPDAKMELI